MVELIDLYADYMIDDREFWLYKTEEIDGGRYWSLVSSDNKMEVFITLMDGGYLFLNVN